MSAIGGISGGLPSPWQQMQNMDAAISNATSGNTDSTATIVSMLSGGSGDSATATANAVSSAMASAETSSFQGYAQLAAQAALKRVQSQAAAAQGGSTDTSGTAAAADTAPAPDPLNQSDPTNPFAPQQAVTLADGTVIKPPSGVDLGNGVRLDPSTGITTMADGTQISPSGVPVNELSTLPVDMPPGFNVDVTA